MIGIRVNNKFFKSLTKAARFIGMPATTLSVALKDKKSIVHKDLLIEKTEIKPTERIKKQRNIPVLVDGIMYNSFKDAEKALGCGRSYLSLALRRGQTNIKGHTIEPVYPSMVGKKKIGGTKVLQVNTGVVFNSIRDASIEADADEWTMSKKMEFAGSFIDKFGNEYKRLTPMDTQKVYYAGNKTVGKYVSPQHNNIIEKRNYIYADLPKAIKELVDEKISNMFESGKSWQEIKDFAKKVGCKQIILKVDDDEK